MSYFALWVKTKKSMSSIVFDKSKRVMQISYLPYGFHDEVK